MRLLAQKHKDEKARIVNALIGNISTERNDVALKAKRISNLLRTQEMRIVMMR